MAMNDERPPRDDIPVALDPVSARPLDDRSGAGLGVGPDDATQKASDSAGNNPTELILRETALTEPVVVSNTRVAGPRCSAETPIRWTMLARGLPALPRFVVMITTPFTPFDP